MIQESFFSMTEPWFQMDTDEVLRELDSSREGLLVAEAERRLMRHGPNVLAEEQRKRIGPLLVRQFTDVMILILLAAAAIAGGMGNLTDAVMILMIVVLNASLGFGQEYRAERALAALRKLEQLQAVVRREGRFVEIPSQELVPGDLMAVNEGQRVPADGRLIEAVQLQLDESQLTGESAAVVKHARTLHKRDLALDDRSNMVFRGTTVLAGRAWVLVTETGMKTEVGRIAHLLQTVEESETPLQLRLAYLGKWLAGAALTMTGVIFIAGLLRGEPLGMMFLTAVSLAVAVIPEGLPVVVTIVLALGAQQMARRNALIRKLPAVETLGSVTTICSDKTGTLTQNIMSVEMVYFAGRLVNITGNGYAPEGSFYEKGERLNPKDEPVLLELLRAAALCTNARLQRQERRWTLLGDPTEGALLAAASKAGLWKDRLETEYPRIAERPFDSSRKRMTTVHRDSEGRVWVFIKGGIEEILPRAVAVIEGETVRPLTRRHHDEILRIHRELAADGVRVLACATRRLEAAPSEADLKGVEDDLVFLGLFGMMDPPRPEVRAAVARCREAGIRPVMITGDHRITAEAVAIHLGIQRPGDRILIGAELESLSREELEPLIPNVSVYARVSPEQKVKIVQAFKRRGDVVAMTGDGVNDAPALRMADIGVAMGQGGTDVAREAADMVLLDNNFATIVSAVKEGRIIYDNIRKFTRYMLSTNCGEIMTMFFAILFGLPLPLLPVQILWVNLVTDGLPALALGVEPPERAVMKRPPRNPMESLFADGLGLQIVWAGLLMGLGTIAVFGWFHRSRNLVHGQTAVFFTLTMFQMFNVLAIRSERDPFWRTGFFSNPQLMGAVALTVGLQFIITYHPLLQPIFHTTTLTGGELAVCVAVALTVYFAVEGEKGLRYRKGGPP
ncbi:MAG: cation-translocating P-type ATPase [Nitrospirae bacterium]|nr:cation-translocating P-type ATPase [Nitrospirota bacterium]